ncbi:hypothetical protein [Sphingomonas azotifigens]|uniref:hypothetical protein n=1 Tax=Sphingomonas azotifigens TaxID=330920 RepID=UPI00142F4639|nr:hypothetical protein [Sphingomonas azotifigens]
MAVGLLSQNDLERLGQTFTRVYRIEDETRFDDLLQAIDRAERDLLRGDRGVK